MKTKTWLFATSLVGLLSTSTVFAKMCIIKDAKKSVLHEEDLADEKACEKDLLEHCAESKDGKVTATFGGQPVKVTCPAASKEAEQPKPAK